MFASQLEAKKPVYWGLSAGKSDKIFPKNEWTKGLIYDRTCARIQNTQMIPNDTCNTSGDWSP